MKGVQLGLALGVLALIVSINGAWQHDDQCKFHCVEQGVHWSALILHAGSWLGGMFIFGFVTGGILPALLLLVDRAGHKQ